MRGLTPRLHLRLPTFGPGDVRALVESMAGAVPAAALELVEQLANGNAFMASAIVRGLVESGALTDGPDGWRFEPTRLAAVRSSNHAAAFLARRLELLPEGALHLLSVAAVLGKEFDFELAADLAGQTAHEAIGAIDESRRRHMVWFSRESTSAAFVHDKLRDALLARLCEAERRQLHHRAARRIQAQDPDRVFELAYHFDAAGERALALPHALAAAAQARRQYSLEVAEQQYRIAQRGASEADTATQRTIGEGLGDVLMLLGRYDEAAAHLEAARELAEEPTSEAQLDGKLGELAFKRGDMLAAAGRIEQALDVLGQRLPRHTAVVAAALVWELIIQIFHTLMPTLFVGRRNPVGAERHLLAIRLYSRLGYAYWFGKGSVWCAWAHFRELNLAERYGPTPELAQAYSNHGPAMTIIPWFGRGVRYVERSLAIRRQLGDEWGEGQSLNFKGIALYCASRYQEAIETCRDAARLLGRMGDAWEANMARLHVVYSQYRLGDLAAAVEGARQLHEAGVALGDRQVSALTLAIWSKATFGQVPGELVQAVLDRAAGDAHTEVDLLMAEGIRLRRQGRGSEAVDTFERAARIIRDKGMRQEYVVPIAGWLATALRQELESARGLTPARRRAALRRTDRAARRACRISRWFRNSRPHALREAALIAALRGRTGRAQKLFNQSLAVARQQGARAEEAQTRLARAQAGVELGWRGSPADLRLAARDVLALGATFGAEPGVADVRTPAQETATLSLVDRFDTVLDAGRRIASALTRDAVFAALREAGASLLRSQHCVVLKLNGDEVDVTTVSGEMAGALDEVGRELALRALTTGETCSFSGELPTSNESSSTGFHTGSSYSALCAPIFVRGRAQACLLATHQKLSGLFGPDEERLAGFLATLAGAALENAEGFAELKHRAFHDSLTNLPNRVLFRERVEHAQARRRRDAAPLAVLFLDLDNFKVVNDSLGHAAGDELLVAVANRLKSCLRPGDSVARLSGDEFAILIESLTQASDAAPVAERVMATLRAPFTVQGREFFVHASGGIAIDDADYESADDLLRDADAAMYAAKGQGKNQFQVFEPALHAAVVARLELGAALQRAVDNQNFLLHYQPIVRLATGEIIGAEALVRWERPGGGLVPPDQFIPMAEETGLIVPIGRWVLEQACRQTVAWHRQLPDRKPLAVTVNLSVRQLQHPGLVDDVAAVLAETGLDPSCLGLEITESVLMKDPEAAAAVLTRLKALGVRLALDDFGTGYSSLSYLQRFPIDVLKIDKCFIDGVGTGHADHSLAHAIVNLGRTLGLYVVAEGIEEHRQWDALTDMSCDLGQGYLFSRPLPADQITDLLRTPTATDDGRTPGRHG